MAKPLQAGLPISYAARMTRPFFLMLLLLCALPAAADAKAPPRPLSYHEWHSIEKSYAEWLPQFEARARRDGISQKTIDAALGDARPLRAVIEADRNQPEFKISFADYERSAVAPRIAAGRDMMRRYSVPLKSAADRYGVAPQYIVALWGFESSFGRFQGNYNVPKALATLAAEGRRRDLFTAELLAALHIIDSGDIDADRMLGSWAGAMGQDQFMPSAFLKSAADGDGDGKRDIWSDANDVFASTANKLAMDGWERGGTWGRAVSLPPLFPKAMVSAKIVRPISTWRELGVQLPDGSALPGDDNMPAALVAPGSGRPHYHGGPIFLTYNNFRAVKKWNNSDYFAVAMGELADAIATDSPEAPATTVAVAP